VNIYVSIRQYNPVIVADNILGVFALETGKGLHINKGFTLIYMQSFT